MQSSKPLVIIAVERAGARPRGVDDTAVLVVLCDVDEQPALIDAAGGVRFDTPRHDGDGAILVRLADVDRDELRDRLEESYRIEVAPTRRRRLDEAVAPAGDHPRDD